MADSEPPVETSFVASFSLIFYKIETHCAEQQCLRTSKKDLSPESTSRISAPPLELPYLIRGGGDAVCLIMQSYKGQRVVEQRRTDLNPSVS